MRHDKIIATQLTGAGRPLVDDAPKKPPVAWQHFCYCGRSAGRRAGTDMDQSARPA